jgi:DNA-binding transcriptional LysR family regulator
MNRLRSLFVFGQIIESRSFTAAARRLNLSTAIVASHVKALEDYLGTPLFNHTGEKVTLTEAGELYHLRSAGIVADMEEAERPPNSCVAEPKAPTRIYANSAIGPLLTGFIADFLQAKPSARVQIDFTSETSALANGRYDLGIEISAGRTPFSSHKLMRWRHRAVASSAYLKAQGAAEKLADLQKHFCLHHGNYPYGTSWRFEAAQNAPHEIAVSPSFISNDVEVLRRLATMGRGVFLAPDFLVEPDIRAGSVMDILPEFRGVEFSTDIVFPDTARKSVKVTELADFLVQRFAKHGN